jgi:hypothetical protein
LIARTDVAFLQGPAAGRVFHAVSQATPFCVWTTTALCLIRGLPVLWDGRVYLFRKYFPREMKDAG